MIKGAVCERMQDQRILLGLEAINLEQFFTKLDGRADEAQLLQGKG